MPIEIRELIIKVQVTDQNPSFTGFPINEEQLRLLKKEIAAECLAKIKKDSSRNKER